MNENKLSSLMESVIVGGTEILMNKNIKSIFMEITDIDGKKMDYLCISG